MSCNKMNNLNKHCASYVNALLYFDEKYSHISVDDFSKPLRFEQKSHSFLSAIKSSMKSSTKVL